MKLKMEAALLPVWVLACASSGEAAAQPPSHTHVQELPAAPGPGFTVADVRFVQNMIGHHAQAIAMAAMAPTHGAGPQVLKLAEKIDISQRDEIAFMERWLRERDQAVPDESQTHAMHMPGMLTPEQMEQLDAARGVEFDRLFLIFMIQHHSGALEMVETLFDSPGAGQDSEIFRFATDVDADQRDEIYVMQSMLDMLETSPGESNQMNVFRRRAGVRPAGMAVTLFAAVAAASPLAAQQDTIATLNDPRVGLAPGAGNDAGVAALNMRLVSHSPKPEAFDSARGLSFINSDLAFRGNIVYQGNFSGFSIWDVSDPAKPVLLSTVPCATDQGDPSIWGNLLFISAEAVRSRNDCGMQGVEDGKDRMRGVRIFDVSDPRNPKLVKNVQTCRGSHTHTIVPHPTDENVIYIYVGGSSGVRDSTELAGCSDGTVDENPNTAQYRVDIIRVPLQSPEQAEVIGYARIFEDLPRPPGRAGQPLDESDERRARGPRGCHDVTAYPAFNLIAGACGSFGLLLDAKDPEHPVRLDAKSDINFSLWHTAVFSNDGKSVVFTDEWGGGTSPRCRATDPLRLGGNTILTIDDNGRMTQHGYFKMLAAQTETENCVSHNGGLIPVPGRDIMVQGWYQGGVNVFDFTDPENPIEIAYFDRGPVDANELVVGGSWGAYWYNGYIYSSELARGLDILELTPSEFLSENEIEAAKLVQMEQYNPQSQPLIEWPPAFPVVRSYLDQLVRNEGLPATRTAEIAAALDAAERATGQARRDQLNQLASQLDADVASASDPDRVRAMAEAVRDLAAATR